MASRDLLAKVKVLHNYVEREFQGVIVAVSDLGVEERSTLKLRTILTEARERIQTALARQRMLLWKFSMESNPAAGHVHSAGDARVQLRKVRKNCLEELAVGSIRAPKDCGIHTASTSTPPAQCQRWPQNSDKIDRDERNRADGELEWKRETLVRMKHLFHAKVANAADEANRAAFTRDILKITQALEQVQRQTKGLQQEKHTRPTAPTCSTDTVEERHNGNQSAETIGVEHSSSSTPARSTCRRDKSTQESATGTTATSSSITISRCSSVAREQQESGVATKNSCSAQSVRNVELRFPE